MDNKFLKLTNAVYKVLDFFPESDPLKNRAKDKALAIMEHLVLINEKKHLPAGGQGWATLGDIFSNEKVKARLLEDIDILLGYLWIGKAQSWLNSVNCLIIANEYEKIKKEIEPATEMTKKLPGMDVPFVAHKDTQISLSPVLSDAGAEKEGAPASFIADDKSAEMSDRQRKIIEFLDKNEKAQVMELQTVLPDVTKRTIRRDLDELLETGKVLRLGDFNQVFYKINR